MSTQPQIGTATNQHHIAMTTNNELKFNSLSRCVCHCSTGTNQQIKTFGGVSSVVDWDQPVIGHENNEYSIYKQPYLIIRYLNWQYLNNLTNSPLFFQN